MAYSIKKRLTRLFRKKATIKEECISCSLTDIALSSEVYHGVIAAIDFGTSNSGYAYALRLHDTDAIEPRIIHLNKWQIGSASSSTDKAPTTVLLKPDKTFDCFGYNAEDKYARLCATNKEKGWWYFEKFKMALYNTKTLSRETKINDAEDKPLPAIQVFSAVIGHMKEKILCDIRMHNADVIDDDILYVLTVPSIWSDAAKQFMREAATCKEVGIKTEQLNLVLEPEAASVYCRHTPSRTVRKAAGTLVGLDTLPVGHRHIIVDLGGGTVDIASHEIVKNECLHEVSNARGNDLGGQHFNTMFVELLALIFGSEVFETWKLKNIGHYLKMQRSIEGFKWKVSNSDEDILLEVPQSLLDILTEKSGKSMEDAIDEVSLTHPIEMCGSNEVLLGNQLVKDCFNGILECIQQQLSDILNQASGLHTVFLVGGMAQSAYIRKHVQIYFQNITLYVPEDPGVAVLKGAVLLGNRSQTIAGRIARFSYGVGVTQTFVEGNHREEYKFIRDGAVLCGYKFEKLIEKGQVLKYGDKFTITTCINAKQPGIKQSTFTIYLYQSAQTSPTYYTEEGCTKVGGFDLHPPEGGWPDYCKTTVEIVVGEAEFKFKCIVEEDLGRKYETKVDFLKSN